MKTEPFDSRRVESPGANDEISMIDDSPDMHVEPQQDLSQQDTNQPPPYDFIEDENDHGLEADSVPDSRTEANSQVGFEDIEETPADAEEESKFLTPEVVGMWDPKETADHLRQMGVDTTHCAIFEEQEITGDVLLSMDQAVFLSEHFTGTLGKRLATSKKVQQFQQDVQAGVIRAEPAPTSEKAVEEVNTVETTDHLQSRNFKHPLTWRQDMTEKLQIQETSDVQLAGLLEDLDPKWIDEDPTCLDSMVAVDRSRDDGGDILLTREQAEFRLGLAGDEPAGIERATSSMCADCFDKFNEHGKFHIYRAT